MWVFTNRGFLSAVQHRDDPNLLMVRARVKGDLKSFFPKCKEIETVNSDYRFRTIVSRGDFMSAMDREIKRITYHNFKDSIAKTDKKRKAWYSDVWYVGFDLQNVLYGVQKFKQWWEDYRDVNGEPFTGHPDILMDDDDDLSYDPETRGV